METVGRGDPLPDEEIRQKYRTHLETPFSGEMEEVSAVISRDVSRTFPGQRFFRSDQGKRRLQRLLEVYAMEDPEVRYVQGMNFLAGFLLLQGFDDEDAFVMLFRMMHRPKYCLRRLFRNNLEGIGIVSHQVSTILRRHLPGVAEHLRHVGCHPHFFFEWYFTLYTILLPLPQAREVWDMFFDQGWPAVFKVMLILLDDLQPFLRGRDMMGTITVLKSYQAHRTDIELGRQDPPSVSGDVLSRRQPPGDLAARADSLRSPSAAEVSELWHAGERELAAETAQRQVSEEVRAHLSRLERLQTSWARDATGETDAFSRTLSQDADFLRSLLRGSRPDVSDGAARAARDE